MDAIITALPQLGIAGAAILVMYLMYKESQARLIAEVEKHQNTLKEHTAYMQEVHQSTMVQLAHASKVIEDNVKAYERVINYLDRQK